jgi:hypothetical protein
VPFNLQVLCVREILLKSVQAAGLRRGSIRLPGRGNNSRRSLTFGRVHRRVICVMIDATSASTYCLSKSPPSPFG